MRILFAIVVGGLLVVGCKSNKAAAPSTALQSSPIAETATGTITGKAVYVGVAPTPREINMAAIPAAAAMHAGPVFEESIVVGAKNELKNVVVYLKDGAKFGGDVPTASAMLNQVGCLYEPHVLLVRVGQEIAVTNHDGFLHNAHALSKLQPEFSKPQLAKGEKQIIPAALVPETYKIRCDVHPWMISWAVVLDHPFAAITDNNGAFSISGLQDGRYTLVAWQEKLGTREAEIEVKNGKGMAEFMFEPKK